MKELENLEKAIKEVIKVFEEKQGLTFSEAMNNDYTDVLFFNDHYAFHIGDIYTDLFLDAPKNAIIDWFEDYTGINYTTFLMTR